MENKQPVASSPITSDLFDAKESPPPSSTGIFASIFPPPCKFLGRDCTCSEFVSLLKQPLGNQLWSNKHGTPEKIAKNNEGASKSLTNKERSSIFQERAGPCPLSSSIYYGGQEDMYIHSSSTQTTGSTPIFKKEVGDDDPHGNNPHSASRGNWWKGSLYY